MIVKKISNTVFSPWTGFWTGFKAPLRAFKLLITSPQTAIWALLPLTINIGLYIAFFIYGSDWLGHVVSLWIAKVSSSMPAWVPSWSISFANWFLKILSWFILGLVAAISFTFVSTLISAPFNEALSRATLKRLRQNKEGSGVPTHIAPGLLTTIKLEASRTLILLGGGIVALLLGIIPFLQIPALVLGSLLLSFEYFGYPISQKTNKLYPVAMFTLRHPFVSLGFGSFLLLMMVLPFTSILYIPLAVVGATQLHEENSFLPR